MSYPYFGHHKKDVYNYEPIYKIEVVRSWKLKKISNNIMSKSLLTELGIDKYFNIYNRNGFEYMMRLTYDVSKIYLVDFKDVKNMNKKLGYMKVNDIFKKTFTQLKGHYTIGRAFSGDEIFFQTYRMDDDINMIENVCTANGLEFKYIEAVYEMGDELEVVLEEMINNFH